MIYVVFIMSYEVVRDSIGAHVKEGGTGLFLRGEISKSSRADKVNWWLRRCSSTA